MARFHFRLASLLRLREAARDERRRHLAEALRAESVLRDHRAALEKNVEVMRRQARAAAQPGHIDVDRLLEAQRYELALRAQVAIAEQQAAELRQEIENRRQALVAADREVRVLEKLRQRHLERFRAEEARREVKRMDEIASLAYSNAARRALREEATS